MLSRSGDVGTIAMSFLISRGKDLLFHQERWQLWFACLVLMFFLNLGEFYPIQILLSYYKTIPFKISL